MDYQHHQHHHNSNNKIINSNDENNKIISLYRSQRAIIIKVAVIVKLSIWIYALIVSQFLNNFDSSTTLKSVTPYSNNSTNYTATASLDFALQKEYLTNHNNESVLVDTLIKRVFVKWDSLYFIRIAEHNYEYEQNHAFFPMFPFLMNMGAKCIQMIPGIQLSFSDSIIVAGFLISNVSFVLGAVQLLKLGYIIFHIPKIAFISALLYCINPAGVFTTAVYTENTFNLFIFTGLIYTYGGDFHWQSNSRSLHMHSDEISTVRKIITTTIGALFFSLATCTRSNGILMPGFIVFRFYSSYFIEIFKHLFKFAGWILRVKNTTPSPPADQSTTTTNHQTRSITNLLGWKELILYPIVIVLQVTIVLVPYIAFQFYGYSRYCVGGQDIAPDAHKNGVWPRPWCNTEATGALFPNLYSFVQNHYWNQGFFNYYTVQQIPNFLFATPIVVISVFAVYRYLCYFIQNGNQMKYLYKLPLNNTLNTADTYNSNAYMLFPTGQNSTQLIYFYTPYLLPFVLYHLFLTLFSVSFMHVQVITRFFMHSPILFWFCSMFFLKYSNKTPPPNPDQRESSNKTKKYLILAYFLFYNILGTVLFTNFYPWT
ncbi:hypothetical protein CYY_002908 [Polysphondylium violaceum]|uniref:GPI mannosyltransferase 2 n=1 Tax=Polysphondylium violaceum TaxID=133409 RepID=A0A8J4PY26_9MYCE|nr:hypothetical protein CYY_002908 [Polysphondylium violaceum]